MLWLLAGVTALVLAVIALMIRDISKTPTVARPAALVRPTHHATPSASPRLRQSASVSKKTSKRIRKIADADSGLSYRLLSSPWRRG